MWSLCFDSIYSLAYKDILISSARKLGIFVFLFGLGKGPPVRLKISLLICSTILMRNERPMTEYIYIFFLFTLYMLTLRRFHSFLLVLYCSNTEVVIFQNGCRLNLRKKCILKRCYLDTHNRWFDGLMVWAKFPILLLLLFFILSLSGCLTV